MLLLSDLKAAILGTAAVTSIWITTTRGANTTASTATAASAANTTFQQSPECNDKSFFCVQDLLVEKLERNNIDEECRHFTNQILECAAAEGLCTSDEERKSVKDKIKKKVCDPCGQRGLCSYSELFERLRKTEQLNTESEIPQSKCSSVALSASGVVVLLAVMLMAWSVCM